MECIGAILLPKTPLQIPIFYELSFGKCFWHGFHQDHIEYSVSAVCYQPSYRSHEDTALYYIKHFPFKLVCTKTSRVFSQCHSDFCLWYSYSISHTLVFGCHGKRKWKILEKSYINFLITKILNTQPMLHVAIVLL